MELFIPILLICAGFLLILVEVYLIPGFNVVGILGFLLVIFAVGYVFLEQGLVGGTLAMVAALVCGGGMFWALWRAGAWQRFILSTSLGAGSSSESGEQPKHFLGRTGRAITPLRPTGAAEFDGVRVEVTTEGEYIAAGSTVHVVAMSRRTHVVRLASDVPA